jgi:hypothetical protein
MSSDSEPIPHFPPPWKLKGTMYCFMFWVPGSLAKAYPNEIAYSPLELKSSFASVADSGLPVGGLATIMVYRYTSSPTGAYDEFILAAGSHKYTIEENGKRVQKKNLRITRIYVSQKVTCWNGRKGEESSQTRMNGLLISLTEHNRLEHSKASRPL